MCGPRPETLITLTRVAHQRKVHQDGGDVPDRNQRQHDRYDRRVTLHQRMLPPRAGA